MRSKRAKIEPKPDPVETRGTVSKEERVLLKCPKNASFSDVDMRGFSDTVWESLEGLTIYINTPKVKLEFLKNFPGLRNLTLKRKLTLKIGIEMPVLGFRI